METLDDKVNETKIDKKSSIWDAMVAAYSSSKSVKILLATLTAGYNYLDCIIASSGFYLAFKTIGILAKSLVKFIVNPLKNYNPFTYENLRLYYPFYQKVKRPHAIGAMLSTTAYATGF